MNKSVYVMFKGVRKHRLRCPICGRAAPDNFCIVHSDVKALDLTKSKKAQKMTAANLRYEKEFKRQQSVKKASQKEKKTTKTKTKKITNAQVQNKQASRTKRAQSMDSKKKAKKVVEQDRYHLWLKHPERYDIEGIDT